MTDQVLNILKLALLGLLYLFFARVLWAVWSEVRAPRQRSGIVPMPTAGAAPPPVNTAPPPAPTQKASRKGSKPKKGRSGRAARVVILEPKQRRGTAVALDGEITLGRDEACTISIDDDGYVSQLHLRFYDVEGQPMVEDLGSTNGTYYNGNRLHGAKLLHPGDRIQVGSTILEAQ